MAQNQMSNQMSKSNMGGGDVVGNVGDVLKDSLEVAMRNVVAALEPQINDLATRYATEAVDRSRVIATRTLRKFTAQPWYLVGAAAVLLVGAAIVIGFNATPDRKEIMH